MPRTTRCQAQDPATCADPRCPARAAATLAFEAALQAGDLSALLSLPRPSAPHPPPAPRTRSARPKPIIGRRIDARDLGYRAQIISDMHASANLTVDPATGRKTVSVYRAGALIPASTRGREARAFNYADGLRPASHRTRTSSLYASPTLDTGRRWVRANVKLRLPSHTLHELRVDPDEVRVYCITNWERAEKEHGYTLLAPHEHLRRSAQESATRYWTQSMTLSAWYAYVEANPEVEPRDWELLLAPTDVQASSKVSWARVSDEAFRDWELGELAQIAARHSRRKR